ncbi:hypothetical protein GCM10023085_42580 [Actinomadura viridis]|uniref:Uncharacterized protein n=1 Tax=Actinomadura viridis TaxID=58110 RepID=A0A931DGG0_9ACTN|nr:hypothetical protein [Actinomadura viridis]MBG6089620.1 hypothetical protein [Actinomadura viridis]
MIEERLRRCGLAPRPGPPAAPLPSIVVGLAASCGRHEGDHRVDSAQVPGEAPDRVTRLNRDWYDLASAHGLFDADREFLVYDRDGAPSRVRLLDDWDVMGEGGVGLFTYAPGHPELGMASLDGRVALVATTWGDGTASSLVLIDPAKAPTVQRYMSRIAANVAASESQRAGLRAWHAYLQAQGLPVPASMTPLSDAELDERRRAAMAPFGRVTTGAPLTDLRNGFRDEEQRANVKWLVHSLLADDHNQEECRYLMRFWWQLTMTYQEVTVHQLREHVGETKLLAAEGLINALRSSPEQVDAWTAAVREVFPFAESRKSSPE